MGFLSQVVVGLDARLLAHERHPTGVGYYVRHLAAWLGRMDGVQLILYTDRPLPTAGAPVRLVGKWPVLPWQQTTLRWALRRDRPGVYHGPTFSVPLATSIPCVVTIHDLSFVRYPAYVNPDTLRYLERMVPLAVRHAARIVTPSRRVAQEVIDLYGADAALAAKVRPIPLGVNLDRWRPSEPEMLARWRRQNSLDFRYLLFVGTREPRKNLGRLIEAFAQVADRVPDVHLVLAGPGGFGSSDGPVGGFVGRRIHVMSYVNEADMPFLVQGALGLCYVSEYEGFGLPVLEAMAVGTPVLTTKDSPMEDLAGPWGLYAAPDDVADIAEGLRRLIGEAETRRRQWEQVWAKARSYTWEETARRTVDVYRELL